MLSRLIYILVGLALLAACAKPPVQSLHETRQRVAQAYAAGASRLAAEQYQIASDALHEAEQLVQAGHHKKANQRLELARRYSAQALSLTEERKQQLLQELARQREAEEARLAAEQAKAAELARQAKVKVEKKAPPVKPPRPAPQPQLAERIEVRSGENLAIVAAREDVYSDQLLWPLIYRANRDQIKDPRQIFPGQTLVIPRDKTPEEQEEAREEARALNLFN